MDDVQGGGPVVTLFGQRGWRSLQLVRPTFLPVQEHSDFLKQPWRTDVNSHSLNDSPGLEVIQKCRCGTEQPLPHPPRDNQKQGICSQHSLLNHLYKTPAIVWLSFEKLANCQHLHNYLIQPHPETLGFEPSVWVCNPGRHLPGGATLLALNLE